MASKKWLRGVFGTTTKPIVTRVQRPPLRLEALDPRINPTQLTYGLFDTGVDGTGAILSGGTDAHYTLTATQQGTVGQAATVLAKNAAANLGTAYINPTGAATSPMGAYAYQTTFTIPAGTNLTNATLTGLVAAADQITDVRVNNTSSGTTANGTTTGGQAFSLTQGLQVGSNTLTFNVSHTNNGMTDLKVSDLVLNVAPPASQQPPVLTGSGNTINSTVNGPAVAVDPGIRISNPSGANLSTASVSISSNLTAGDVLAFTPVGGISGTYNAASGILTLSGSDTAANYQTALRSVTLRTTAVGNGPRTVSFSIAPGQFDPANGHFYQFVTSQNINWGAAEAAASGSSIFGAQGYLSTPRNAAENNFAFSKVGAQRAWLGMSDSFTEDYWQRVTGPDAGVHFFNQTPGGNGGTPVGGLYNNWDPSTPEPNNANGNEDYAHFLPTGLWNDYNQTTPVAGYIVEYGGSPNDPVLELTSQTTATVANQTAAPTVTSPAGPTFTAANTFTITGTAPAGSLVQIYNDPNNTGMATGTPVGTQQLAAGQTTYSISVPLTANTPNNFLATATSAPAIASVPVKVPTITQDTLAFTTTTLANPTTGQTYSQPITTTGGSGMNRFAFSRGSQSDGLTIDPNTGTISGTPAAAGTFAIRVQVTDSNGFAAFMTYNVMVSDPLAVTTTTIAPVSTGVPYSQQIATTGGNGTNTFTLASGTLPAGLMLDPTTGLISGTPTGPGGMFSFSVTATDTDGRTATSPVFTGTVTAPLAVTTTAIPPVSKGVPYSATIATTGGRGPNTFVLNSGPLPAGLMLDSATGTISGTPTTDGPFSFSVTAQDADGRMADSPTFSGTVADPLALAPTTLAPTTLGQTFTQTETTTGGEAPDMFAVTAGMLPAGLMLNATTGVISGSPTTDGPVMFTVTATDAAGRTAAEPYTGQVVDPLAITTPTLAAPTRGQPYTQPVVATGGRGPDTFAVASGTLPAGLMLDPTTGVISGTPTTDAPFSVTVQVTDADGRTASVPYTGQVSDPLTLGPTTLAPTTTGTPFTQTEVPTGGRGPTTFAVSAGALPAGLTLDPTTGVISGTPTTTGPVNFAVTATDADGRASTQVYAGTVVNPLAITTTTLPGATRGTPYSQPVTPTGGRGPDTFAVSAGALPAGLTLDPATGVISGTATTTGPTAFTVTVTDADGRTATRSLTVGVTDPITFPTTALPDGTTGTTFTQSVAATGGTAPLTYAVSAGALPGGLTLNPATGALTGSPTAPGTYTFTVTATDAAGAQGSQTFTLVVADPLSLGGTGTLPGGIAGAAYANPVPTTGGTRPVTFAVTAGSLPPGFALNSGTGAVAGTSALPGTYTFTVTATDARGRTASRVETITIQAGSNLSQFYGVAAGLGGASRVEVYDRQSGAKMADFYAFEPSFKGGANVVVGDVNGDGVPDIVVAAGAGGGARVEVIDGTKMTEVGPDGQISPDAVLANFFAFDENLRGGASVALARLDNGKGLDIVVGAGLDGGPRVRSFSFTPGVAGGVTQLPGAIGSFYAFDPSQRFGVNVAAGNLDATGVDDVIVGEGLGAAPMVAVFRADGSERERFTADNLAPAGGAFVAAGYLDGTPQAQLVAGTGPGGPPNVDIYSGTATTPERIVQAFEPTFTGGVSVNSGPSGQQSNIFLGAGPGGGPRVRVLTPDGVRELFNFFSYEPTFQGGVNVG